MEVDYNIHHHTFKCPPYSQLKRPSLNGPHGPLFFQAPPALRDSTVANLERTLEQLKLVDGDEISVTDAALPFQLSLLIRYSSSTSS